MQILKRASVPGNESVNGRLAAVWKSNKKMLVRMVKLKCVSCVFC